MLVRTVGQRDSCEFSRFVRFGIETKNQTVNQKKQGGKTVSTMYEAFVCVAACVSFILLLD